jgi:hypothetical protein
VYSLAERVFILEHYIALELFASVRDVFNIAGHKCLSVTRAHRATKWLPLGPYPLQAVNQLEQRIQLEELCIATGFVILYVKGFVCSSYCCILNATSYFMP